MEFYLRKTTAKKKTQFANIIQKIVLVVQENMKILGLVTII